MNVIAMDGFGRGGMPETRPQFGGTAAEMAPLVYKGLLLTFLTLGIYRFWYQTDVRRFLWSRTSVDGDRLEYTGRGVELFIGFLIALAVLIPLYALATFLSLIVGPAGPAVMQPLLTLGLLVLAQYGLYRARRYRLTRTIWRGIRFQQSGSGWVYAGRSMIWGLLTILTLGLAYPFMRASLERYKMNNTWFGDQKAAFSGTGWTLFKRGVLLWFLAWLLVLGPLAAIGGVGYALHTESLPQFQGAMSAGALALFALVSFAILFPLFQAIEFRWWANACAVGPATVRCDLRLSAFLRVYLGFIAAALLFSILVGAVAIGGGYAVSRSGSAEWPGVVFAALLYFAAILGFAGLWQIFGARPLWKRSLEGVAIAGLAALTAAQSTAPEGSAFGEGVADALDFGGF
jgi:uncharacterized membrane protein YjgN (DUF898 family)